MKTMQLMPIIDCSTHFLPTLTPWHWLFDINTEWIHSQIKKIVW